MNLEEALGYFGGSKARMAEELGISKQAVSKWRSGKPIPELRAFQIRQALSNAKKNKSVASGCL